MEGNPNENNPRLRIRSYSGPESHVKNVRAIEKAQFHNKSGFGELAEVRISNENGEDRGSLVFKNGQWEIATRIESPTFDLFYQEALQGAAEKYPNG